MKRTAKNFPYYLAKRDRWVFRPKGHGTQAPLIIRHPDGKPVTGKGGRKAAFDCWMETVAMGNPRRRGADLPVRVVFERFLDDRLNAVSQAHHKTTARIFNSFVRTSGTWRCPT